jgi:hypothetical protein
VTLLEALGAATDAVEEARRSLAAAELGLSQLWQVLRLEGEKSSPGPPNLAPPGVRGGGRWRPFPPSPGMQGGDRV